MNDDKEKQTNVKHIMQHQLCKLGYGRLFGKLETHSGDDIITLNTLHKNLFISLCFLEHELLQCLHILIFYWSICKHQNANLKNDIVHDVRQYYKAYRIVNNYKDPLQIKCNLKLW